MIEQCHSGSPFFLPITTSAFSPTFGHRNRAPFHTEDNCGPALDTMIIIAMSGQSVVLLQQRRFAEGSESPTLLFHLSVNTYSPSKPNSH